MRCCAYEQEGGLLLRALCVSELDIAVLMCVRTSTEICVHSSVRIRIRAFVQM